MAETGSFGPINEPDSKMSGWRCEADFLEVSGFLITERHPNKISVSDGAIDFDYKVDDDTITRSYALERDSSGRITAFVHPDGARTEVVR